MSSTSRRQFLSGALRVAGGLAIAACAPSAPASPAASATSSAAVIKKGGKLAVATLGDQKTLDPAYITTFYARTVSREIYDTLVDIDPKGNFIPALAERWEMSDPRTWLVHLRTGVRYPDGTEFDAEVAKFNIDRHLDPATKSRQVGEINTIDKVEIVDKGTVRIRLKSQLAEGAFLSPFYDRVGYMPSPAAVQKWGNEQYGLHPVGLGPFRLVDYKDSSYYVVERNPDYWDKGKPHVDQVTWKIVPLDATRLIELRSGGVHVGLDLPLQNVTQMKSMPEIVLSEKAGARFYFMRWNLESPFGKSLEMRQALNWLLDREAIFNAVFFKTGVIGFDPFLPGQPFHDPNYKPFTRDLSKAKALLDKAQLPTPRKFTIYTDSGAIGQKLAQITQANLAEVGIDVDIRTEEIAALQAHDDSGDLTLSMSSTGRFAYRPDPAQYIGSQWYSKSTYYKHGKLVDAETDKLIDQGQAESDKAKRYAIYRQLAVRLSELASSVFFEHAADFTGVSPKLRGFTHMPDALPRLKGAWLEE